MMSWSMALRKLSKSLKNINIFLNCNPYFIESSEFLKIKSIFVDNEIQSHKVILEITEISAISDYKLFYQRLQQFRDHGFRFAVDDVGGGYASLESIVGIQPEVVKIDPHIVNGIQEDPYKRSIVKFIVNFCKENDVLSIAEGIENEKDLNIVRELGIDAGQGFYLHRPTPQIERSTFTPMSKNNLGIYG